MAERIGEGELAVMEVLWAAERPLTAVEITQAVDPERGWSESTVKTMLSRLVTKGVLASEGQGRRFLYTPVIAREAYAAGESRRFIDRLFGGRAAPLIAHLAQSDNLSEDDIRELEAVLKGLQS